MKNIQNKSEFENWLNSGNISPAHREGFTVFSSCCRVAPSEITGTIWPWYFAYEEWFRGYVSAHRDNRNLTIEFVLQGDLKIKTSRREILVKAGSAAVVLPGSSRTEAGPSGSCRKVCLVIGGSILDALLTNFSFSGVELLAEFPDDLIFSMKKLILLILNKEEDDIDISGCCYRFLLEIARKRSNSLPQELLLALHTMRANIGSPLTIHTLAKDAHCSRQELQKLFRIYLGETPFEHFIKLRLNTAKEMLKNSDLPIKEIAQQCGYRSQLYFSTDFRKHFNSSPKEFRKTWRSDLPNKVGTS